MYLRRAGTEHAITTDTLFAFTSEFAIVAYFFAMRSCEFTLTPQPAGETKIVIRLRGVVFRDRGGHELAHDSTELHTAYRVTLTFEDQKNGTKNDRRTHQQTSDPVLCPLKRIVVSIVQRIIIRIVLTATQQTSINTIRLLAATTQILSTTLRQFIRSTCILGGGRATFGYDANDVGTKSIRSGAAMGLFLMNHPVHEIMILGRWSPDAILVYIRPQVLEWTNNMSHDMIHNNSFMDATDSRKTQTSDPRKRQCLFNGDTSSLISTTMQEMNLHH